MPAQIVVPGQPLFRGPEPSAHAVPSRALADPSNRVMWITLDRVFYAGLLGTMSTRTMGGWLVYASLGAPLRVALDRAGQGASAGQDAHWQTGHLAVVPPYVPHRVACDERLICSLTLEPESLDPQRLPALLQGEPGVRPDHLGLLPQLRQAHAWLRSTGRHRALKPEEFDAVVLGQALPMRQLDRRIDQVLQRMRLDPAATVSAQDSAAAVGLSCSRFLHLFKDEVGASFRAVRTWKRARSLLQHVSRPANLAHLALDSGYPDSTHFSHSIRQVYGLTPRDLFAGSRRLTLLGAGQRRPA